MISVASDRKPSLTAHCEAAGAPAGSPRSGFSSGAHTMFDSGDQDGPSVTQAATAFMVVSLLFAAAIYLLFH
jgi:hypothetical protein